MARLYFALHVLDLERRTVCTGEFRMFLTAPVSAVPVTASAQTASFTVM